MALGETANMLSRLFLKDDFSGPAKQIAKNAGAMGKAIDQNASRSYRAGQQIGTGIKRGALIAAGALSLVAGATVVFGKKAISAASDLSETISKVGVVFGKQSAAILAFGKTSAFSLGLSENAALAANATFGNLFVSMGLTQKKSADMSLSLVKLAADLASFNNIDPAEALEKLRAGLTGESEPLKTLGININEQILKAEALRLGLVKLTKGQKTYTAVLDPAIKAQAAYSLIMKQSKTAQGDVGRTADGLANQLRFLRAGLETFTAQIGSKALPQVAKLVKLINTELAKPSTLDAVGKIADSFAGLFTDANIEAGSRILKNVFQTAITAAPILQRSAEATLALVKAAVSVFNTMPDWVKTIAVSAFAVNKLTGGLVTNIAGAIGDVFLKQRGATPANPLFVSDVTGGVGKLLPGAAGAAGAAGSIASGFAAISIPLLAGVVVSTLGIMGLGWLINATSSPEQQAAGRQNVIDANRQKRGAPPLPASSAGLGNPLLDRGGREGGTPGLTGQITGSIRSILNAATRAINGGFSRMIAALKNARTGPEIAKAVHEAVRQVITNQKGSLNATKDTVSGLRALLKRTDDPGLKKEIRAALAKVQAKIPGREFAIRQIQKADAIAKSTKLNADKITALQKIERDLKDRGLPHAATRIREKINEAKNAEVAALHTVNRSVLQKQSIYLTTQVQLSLRNLNYTTQTAINIHAGGAPGAYHP